MIFSIECPDKHLTHDPDVVGVVLWNPVSREFKIMFSSTASPDAIEALLKAIPRAQVELDD